VGGEKLMADEINNPVVGTQVEGTETIASPETGQEEIAQVSETEQAEIGTDNAEVTPEKFKSLQAEFTRKSQEYADFKKRYDKETQELNAYRQLYAQQNRQPQQVQQPAKDFNQMSEMEKFNYLVMQQMQPVLEPLQQEIAYLKQINNSLMAMEDKRIWNGFVEKNPDATEYREKIYEMVAKHKIDPDEAWALLNKDKLKDNVKQEVLKEFQVKKDASKLMKPVSTPSTPINETVSSFDDAYKKALKELGIK
jgi:uncharacterized protein YeaO (DUF488 family)